jgi:hypothetical protein
MRIEHTYTVRATGRRLHHDGNGIQPNIELSLDKQPGGPALGWPSLPHSILIFGDELCAGMDLGAKVKLSLVSDS